jgi:DNA-binding NtrC family response regulator
VAEDVKHWMRRQGLRQVVLEGTGDDLPLNLKELETWAIRTAIQRSNGNKSRASVLLGISRDSLYRKLQEIEHIGKEGGIVRFSDRQVATIPHTAAFVLTP